jgi:hypothetical protein
MLAEILARLLVAVGQMYKRQPGTSCLNLSPKFTQLGDRLAAKRSTKMPQEN